MDERQKRILEEAKALWATLHGETPPPVEDGPALLDMITREMSVARYGRLYSPHLRPGEVKGPEPRRR